MAKRTQYADDDTVSTSHLLHMRIPSLIIGLFLGIMLSFTTSRFEEVLANNIEIAFFIPFIVYMADAVGTQTQNIYVRDLKTGHASFKKYLIKETSLGFLLGVLSSIVVGVITFVWFASIRLTMSVSLAMFGAILMAPLVSLLVTKIFQLEHNDPAVGSGPIATVIQDTLSIFIYGLIASAIMR